MISPAEGVSIIYPLYIFSVVLSPQTITIALLKERNDIVAAERDALVTERNELVMEMDALKEKMVVMERREEKEASTCTMSEY